MDVTRLILKGAAHLIDARESTNGQTALWQACQYGSVDMVRQLLDAGADPVLEANDGTTPMAVAQRDGQPECIKVLEVSPASDQTLLSLWY